MGEQEQGSHFRESLLAVYKEVIPQRDNHEGTDLREAYAHAHRPTRLLVAFAGT